MSPLARERDRLETSHTALTVIRHISSLLARGRDRLETAFGIPTQKTTDNFPTR
ncbi:hypothetical protein H6F44_12670 [Pseudanabaena sp. FACHB-1277]|uniref:Uncharacterized protein n=1 Tax=Pseudanabaena cinerea FACHB-1277 TaxID=2949581 RepID=A0A926Z6R7_9CYAN|nr:hypothetical protein [Pseudanabaena cinerea FACHB-1277]